MISEDFNKAENILKRYKNIIALAILFMLLMLSGLTYKFFDKQDQIIDTCGYTEGKIKCVCTEEAWNEYEKSLQSPEYKLNFSIEDGK